MDTPLLASFTENANINRVMAGALIMAFGVAGLLFLRFWRKSRDRLFAIFALAFWAMAVNRLLISMSTEAHEARNLFYYAVRLVAFLLILWAIIDKNRSSRVSSPALRSSDGSGPR